MSNVEVAIQRAMLKKYAEIIGGTPERWMCLCMLQDGHIGLKGTPKNSHEWFMYRVTIEENPLVDDGWPERCIGVRLH